MSWRQPTLLLNESETLLVGCRYFGHVYQVHLGFAAETIISTRVSRRSQTKSSNMSIERLYPKSHPRFRDNHPSTAPRMTESGREFCSLRVAKKPGKCFLPCVFAREDIVSIYISKT
jgi:hypothetical protein